MQQSPHGMSSGKYVCCAIILQGSRPFLSCKVSWAVVICTGPCDEQLGMLVQPVKSVTAALAQGILLGVLSSPADQPTFL